MNEVTSRRRRQRVCSKETARERGEREETGKEKGERERGRGEAAPAAAGGGGGGGGGGGSLGFAPTCSCANPSPACQASVRGVVRNVHSCGSERETERKWKNPIAPDVDTDCRSSRLY